MSLVIVASVLLVACAPDPLEYRITEANQESIMDDLKDSKMTTEQFQLLVAAQMRSALDENVSLVGKTVGEVISDERIHQAEQAARKAEEERLAEEARLKAEADAAVLREAITLTVYDKGFIEGRFEDQITIKIAYENTSDKDIRAFTGVTRFLDLFGREIFKSNITIDDPIAVGSKETWSGGIDYNQFMDTHQKLRNTDLEDMRVEWLPATILFSDGTVLGEPIE